MLAHGAFVTVVDKTGFEGLLDPVCYERLGAAFREARAQRAHFGQRPVQDVGIYFSSRTRDWVGREKPADYFQSFQGAHKAMVYEHIPWGVVLDENVTPESLEQYPVVLLPNAGIVSEREVNLFRRYVENGGKLIITGLGGCYDHLGRMQTSSSLEPLIGARFVRRLDSSDNWVRFDQPLDVHQSEFSLNPRAQAGAVPLHWPFLVKGPAMVLEPTTATAIGELLKLFRTTRQLEGKEGTKWPLNADAPVGPAILLNDLGKGRVLTFACSPDGATASEHHIAEARRLLGDAVRFLNPSPRLEISAPLNVETIVTDDPASRTLRIHLIAYQSPPQTTPAKERPYVLPALLEDTPMYRGAITSARHIKHVGALNRSTVLKQKRNRVEFTVEDIHDCILIRYE